MSLFDEVPVDRCESDIEREFFMHIQARNKEIEVLGFQLCTQYWVSHFRLDFAFVAQDGRRVGVELDGHEYHERTPEQAERDRRRDRYLVLHGWRVIRFTGREINRDCFGCVEETLTHLRQISSTDMQTQFVEEIAAQMFLLLLTSGEISDQRGDQLSETTRKMMVDVAGLSTVSATTVPRKRHTKRVGVAKFVSPLAAALRGSKKNDFAIAGVVLTCFLDGQPIPRSPLTTDDMINDMIISAMKILGRKLPAATRWAEVLDFAQKFISVMNISAQQLNNAEIAFYLGQGKRNYANSKKSDKVLEWYAERARVFGTKA